ncbi:PepSY domain-containing protein [Pontibacter burrus]|uniref:Uncharacterized protein n=1 Tax=Pontibacter burrus TaxID=2704466 RepID=A0A6B3M1B4_9BACT|nr:PepSY domain-containing protein [Pontibacter burrus]NEM99628.1 hypothetical protein [Pontibacter burrus]
MRTTLLAIFLILPVFSFGQRYFSIAIVNERTGEPVGPLYCTVLKNNDQFVNCGMSKENGLYRFYVKDYDSTATYQVEILNRWQNYVESGRHDISTMNDTIPIVKVRPATSVTNYTCPTISYSNYTPKEPYSFDELPKNIQKKVKQHLVKRVGKSFYGRLKLNGGQILNLNRFYELNPEAKAEGYVPYSYNLCFRVTDSQGEGNLYSFNLALDQSGDLMKEIDLPDIKNNPKKAQIISLAQATEIAQKGILIDSYTRTNSYYDSDAGSIVWEFEQITYEPKVGNKSIKLIVNAHSGEIIGKRTDDIIILE